MYFQLLTQIMRNWMAVTSHWTLSGETSFALGLLNKV
jgi:hypothetical protein